MTALAVVLAVAILLVWAVSSIGGDGDSSATADKPPELPRGGRTILPRYRVVTYYGAPQHDELGVLGIGTPAQAGSKLIDQSRAFTGQGRLPVLPAFELIAVLAHSAPGADGMHRERQADEVIRSYLEAVRRIKGILILDIQPGRADFLDEVRALEPYLRQPDVSLALDPEWSVPEGVTPGQQIGSTDAATINDVSSYMSRLVQTNDLPQKLLLVHQFTEDMVRDRRDVQARPGVAIVSNIDGFGTPPLKTNVYRQLTAEADLPAGLGASYIGFKLFYKEDTDLMGPPDVLALRPQPAVVVYE
jgi:hypothetical protein